jgi:hypothetical protein
VLYHNLLKFVKTEVNYFCAGWFEFSSSKNTSRTNSQ